MRLAALFLLCLSLVGCHHESKPTVVLLGDSITFGMETPCEHGKSSLLRDVKFSALKIVGRGCAGLFDIHKELPEYNVVVMGYPGRRTDQLWNDSFQGAHGEDHVAEALALHPSTVILMIGTNDMRVHVQPSVAIRNLQAIKRRLSAQIPRVLVANIPYLTEASHEAITQFNAASGAQIDYFSALDSRDAQNTALFVDGIHPNRDGRRKMLAALIRVLTR